jgi:hypothetical protein
MRTLLGMSTAAIFAVGVWAAPAASAATTGGAWDLDELSGTVAADSSGSGNNGTILGPVQRGVPGHTGTGFSFAAPGSWVEVKSKASLNPGKSSFSFSAWVNFSRAPASGETYDVIRKGLSATAGGEYKLEIISGGRAKCEAKDVARVRGVMTFPKLNLADGQWHQVGCARTATGWSVIVDGKVKTKAIVFGSIGNTKSLSIGSNYGKEDFNPGVVDEVRLSIG